ncbi:hypothetical protein CPB84DRAFT_1755985 [Gymnopilus junonius]|uniref:Uncharacterized protein n=1 Tax=Gymnopilus junonius TaxID=109634 RepID=A0A9P5N6Q4_GYMJU|nr:hypothetical protein CPB84DRAFT_1755985 [Gymnopilus junonius]
MFIPLPSADVCDQTSPSSLKIAQTVSRTWYNHDPSFWFIVPERVSFHPHSKGMISSPYTVFSQNGTSEETMSQGFKGRLARDGPLGMEGMDDHASFDMIPMLIRSEEAWTPKTWTGGFVPSYIHLDLDRGIFASSDLSLSSISDPFIHGPSDDLPVSRENFGEIEGDGHEMPARREVFAPDFDQNGIPMWITCGYFHPDPIPDVKISLDYMYALYDTQSFKDANGLKAGNQTVSIFVSIPLTSEGKSDSFKKVTW